MDDNLRDVLTTAITALATLGGIALGWLIQRGSRFDDQKRIAYRDLLVTSREATDWLGAEASVTRPGSIDEWARRLRTTAAEVDILASKSLVGETARMYGAMNAMARAFASEPGQEAALMQKAAVQVAQAAIESWLSAARRDLGIRS